MTDKIENLNKAGEIAKQAKELARQITKKGTPLVEIANKIEDKIIELGGKPAFPTNLSINEIAAHSTPTANDETKAEGLLKIDLGVHVDGWVADTAFSLDLENDKENKKLIETAEACLKNAIEKTEIGTTLGEIGKTIADTAKEKEFLTIINLSGHSIDQYDLHSGTTIPNYDNNQTIELEEGTYAIEPFVTNGAGRVRDGKPSGIYVVERESQVRDPFAREVLAFILEEFQTLPFCQRWLVKKFGSRAILALKRIEDAGILHQYPQLIEAAKGKVAQAEHTIVLTEKEKIVTT